MHNHKHAQHVRSNECRKENVNWMPLTTIASLWNVTVLFVSVIFRYRRCYHYMRVTFDRTSQIKLFILFMVRYVWILYNTNDLCKCHRVKLTYNWHFFYFSMFILPLVLCARAVANEYRKIKWLLTAKCRMLTALVTV